MEFSVLEPKIYREKMKEYQNPDENSQVDIPAPVMGKRENV